MTFRASSGGWGRSPGRMASSGALVLGPEMATTSSINGVAIGGPATTTYPIANSLVIGANYLVTATVSGYSGTLSLGFTGGTEAFTGVSTALRTRASNGVISFTGIAAFTTQTMFTRDVNTANFTNISIRQIF